MKQKAEEVEGDLKIARSCKKIHVEGTRALQIAELDKVNQYGLIVLMKPSRRSYDSPSIWHCRY